MHPLCTRYCRQHPSSTDLCQQSAGRPTCSISECQHQSSCPRSNRRNNRLRLSVIVMERSGPCLQDVCRPVILNPRVGKEGRSSRREGTRLSAVGAAWVGNRWCCKARASRVSRRAGPISPASCTTVVRTSIDQRHQPRVPIVTDCRGVVREARRRQTQHWRAPASPHRQAP